MFSLMAVDPGPLLAAVLREWDMSQKEAAWLTGHTNPAEFSRALAGERVLDLKKVMRLPWPIFAAFWKRLIAEKADDDVTTLREERLLMARADLRASAAERKAG